MTRLVAVLGYSEGSAATLHPIGAARLERAAEEAGPNDTVLFSGWARGASPRAEADLMVELWRGTARMRLVDRSARTTLGNALAISRAAQRVGADEIVLVTSRWHAQRAATLVRAALAGSGARLRVAATDEPVSPRRGVREAGAWLLVPVLALVAVRNR